jgi:hypothetical protein
MDRFQVLFEIYRKNLEEFNAYQQESLQFLMGFLNSYVDFYQDDLEKFLDQPESNRLGFDYPTHT